jgi:hypothetical protein
MGKVLLGQVRRSISVLSVCTGHVKPSAQKVNQTRIPAVMGGLAMVAMTTGGRSEQVDLGDSNSEQLRHCPGDTRVTFGLFACIEEGGIIAMV